MSDRVQEALAERLYHAHNDLRRDLSEAASPRPYWWALREELQAPYREAAKLIDEFDPEEVG